MVTQVADQQFEGLFGDFMMEESTEAAGDVSTGVTIGMDSMLVYPNPFFAGFPTMQEYHDTHTGIDPAWANADLLSTVVGDRSERESTNEKTFEAVVTFLNDHFTERGVKLPQDLLKVQGGALESLKLFGDMILSGQFKNDAPSKTPAQPKPRAKRTPSSTAIQKRKASAMNQDGLEKPGSPKTAKTNTPPPNSNPAKPVLSEKPSTLVLSWPWLKGDQPWKASVSRVINRTSIVACSMSWSLLENISLGSFNKTMSNMWLTFFPRDSPFTTISLWVKIIRFMGTASFEGFNGIPPSWWASPSCPNPGNRGPLIDLFEGFEFAKLYNGRIDEHPELKYALHMTKSSRLWNVVNGLHETNAGKVQPVSSTASPMVQRALALMGFLMTSLLADWWDLINLHPELGYPPFRDETQTYKARYVGALNRVRCECEGVEYTQVSIKKPSSVFDATLVPDTVKEMYDVLSAHPNLQTRANDYKVIIDLSTRLLLGVL